MYTFLSTEFQATTSNVASQLVQSAAGPQQIVLPAKDAAAMATPGGQPQPQKVQYVYKQGGQTIVIDAPKPLHQAATAGTQWGTFEFLAGIFLDVK